MFVSKLRTHILKSIFRCQIISQTRLSLVNLIHKTNNKTRTRNVIAILIHSNINVPTIHIKRSKWLYAQKLIIKT